MLDGVGARWPRSLLMLGVTLAACAGPPAPGPAMAPPGPLAQPPNVGDAKRVATAYHDSGAYARDLATVAAGASEFLGQRIPQVSRPAVVFDVDETALSNWEVIRADDFGRIIGGPCTALPERACG